jgi:hypothetical protein
MTSDIRYTPSSTHLYGLYDPDGDGITFYKSAAERDEAAEKAIQGYEAFGIWYQGVTGIFAFMVTHCATCIDVARPVGETRYEKEGRYEAGEYWPNTDCNYKWNYALKPFPTPEAPNDVINPPVLATHSTPQPPADGELTVNLRMDLSSESLERLCDGLAAAVKPNGGYRALTTDDDISGEFIGEQQVGVEWWLPEHGCDSLENTLDSIKGRLLAAVRDWLPTAVISTSQPPADGEVAELVESVRKDRQWLDLRRDVKDRILRIADLLQRQHLQPVAVSERLPGAEDCDEQGRCWWGFEETDDYEPCWTLRKMHGIPFSSTRFIPANALPTTNTP